MHKELVLSAFKKAKKEVQEATGVTMSVTGLSKKISDYLMDEYHFQYHEKSLRNKYNLAVKEEIVELKSSVANYLCRYLGFNNYADFIVEKEKEANPIETAEAELIETDKMQREPTMGEKLKIIIQKNKVTLIFSGLIFGFLFLIYFGLYVMNKQDFMLFEAHQYVTIETYTKSYDVKKIQQFERKNL
ncbi:MAG: hypothetical protein AAF611_04910 [Bacteroidota bacterium]